LFEATLSNVANCGHFPFCHNLWFEIPETSPVKWEGFFGSFCEYRITNDEKTKEAQCAPVPVERPAFSLQGEEPHCQLQTCNLIGKASNGVKRQQNGCCTATSYRIEEKNSTLWTILTKKSKLCLAAPPKVVRFVPKKNFQWICAYHLHFNRLNRNFD